MCIWYMYVYCKYLYNFKLWNSAYKMHCIDDYPVIVSVFQNFAPSSLSSRGDDQML
jgi:hypothetical protein